ncbi:S8 family serine peptidase [Emticicia sp. 21SJ11W-3]|uniref:S8 family serine peptidase n=1 Tax=Emticicia sp. 21SJ11W-3 TaxID=2916755 RepID=UPI00209F6F62|nr:S8 family serine peptidase [Emticicia sp. 21SJ11W-3]UTA70203.1 S8 family serine peptidase [Emticicia sp. 21SJ11W-3]
MNYCIGMASVRQIFIFLSFFSSFSFQGFSQHKYWVLFKDKETGLPAAVSEQCKENRKTLGIPASQYTDIPVCGRYISILKSYQISPVNESRWLNGISAYLLPEQLQVVRNLPFVSNVILIDSKLYPATINRSEVTDDIRVDFAMKQVGVEGFLQTGLNGNGVTIGVIDAGYYGVSESPALGHLLTGNRILGVRDYINPRKTNHFDERETGSDFHGTEVLTAITGKTHDNKIQFGLATQAKFYLARTDTGGREFRGEEDNWVAAMEWMDSLGVRLINTSLGYAKGFSNPREDYRPEQMNGNTSTIAKAARIATEEKGIILVVSAGNEGGDRDWRIISTPADVEGVIAVGATNENGLKMGYSSIGPDFLDYLKPNVSCYSLYGTSLAAPVITGFVACLLQANPKLTNKAAKNFIEKSASLYPFGNNYIGYGIPNAAKALDLMMSSDKEPLDNRNRVRTVSVPENERNIEINVTPGEVVSVFHKRTPTLVVSQDASKARQNTILLKRNAHIKHTTIVKKDEVIEIIWL